MTNEEKLITFFQEKMKNSETNEVNIGMNDIQQIGLTERGIIQTIYLLQADDIIDIKRSSVHNDFSMFWTVALKSKCIHYFDNKKKSIVYNRREWVRTYIPITISLIALIKSFLPEITSIAGQLLKLLKQ